MNILVINCGSSSLKFQLIDSVTEKVLAKGICERIGISGSFTYQPAGGEKIKEAKPMPTHTEAMQYVVEALTDKETGVVKHPDDIQAVGHRVVHGGEKFSEATLITDDVIKEIEACVELAPLHNPANITGINVCRDLLPNAPMVAVFDTAFHQTMPPKAYIYGIPYKYYEKYHIRRYGFHGTSHSYVSKRIAEIVGMPYDQAKTIVCHLGNGASVCAVENGKSVDTTMGFTPLDGLIMGTRSGAIDPAIMEFIAEKENLSIEEVLDVLNKHSGVLGISDNLSSDFRDLEVEAEHGNDKAILAQETFSYKVAKFIGSYVTAMNGVDNIAFTAGIGENDSIIRSMVCKYLGYLGITLDEEANKTRGQEIRISTPDSKVNVYVVPTNEELAIARETAALVK